MPKAALGTSTAVARLLKDRRQELGYTLRQVEKKSAGAGRLIPFSTLSKIEQGKLDPGLKRLQLLLRLYDLPMSVAGELMEIEDLAGARPRENDPEKLRVMAVEAMKKGDIPTGLARFLKLQEVLPSGEENRFEHQRAMHNFATALSTMGKYHLARRILDNLLLEDLDPGVEVPILLAVARVWNALGSATANLAFVGRARELVRPDDHQNLAWVEHAHATALESQGDYSAAARKVEDAIQAYRTAEDRYGENRAYGLLFRIFMSSKDLQGALRVARAGVQHAQEHHQDRLLAFRHIDLAEVLLVMNDAESALEPLGEALADSVRNGDRSAQFYTHYYLWKAHCLLGDGDRARVERDNARYFIRFVDESTKETQDIRRLMT